MQVLMLHKRREVVSQGFSLSAILFSVESEEATISRTYAELSEGASVSTKGHTGAILKPGKAFGMPNNIGESH